jgi:hypothetical protein
MVAPVLGAAACPETLVPAGKPAGLPVGDNGPTNWTSPQPERRKSVPPERDFRDGSVVGTALRNSVARGGSPEVVRKVFDHPVHRRVPARGQTASIVTNELHNDRATEG